jgi:hypothetical protein
MRTPSQTATSDWLDGIIRVDFLSPSVHCPLPPPFGHARLSSRQGLSRASFLVLVCHRRLQKRGFRESRIASEMSFLHVHMCSFAARLFVASRSSFKFYSYFDDNNHDAVSRTSAPYNWQATSAPYNWQATKATALFG